MLLYIKKYGFWPIVIWLYDHGCLRLDFVDFNSKVLPICPFAVPSLPNFHLLGRIGQA